MANKVLSAESAKTLDQLSIEKFGIPSVLLMDHAGRQVAETIFENSNEYGSLLFLIGSGNNGGDGLSAVRWLQNLNYPAEVKCLVLKERSKLKEDPMKMLEMLELDPYGPELEFLSESEESLDLIRENVMAFDTVIESLFGIGLNRAIEGFLAKVLEELKGYFGNKITVDVPAGIDTDTGKPLGEAYFEADLSITFGCLKPCHLLGQKFCGEVNVAEIGFSAAALEEVPVSFRVLEKYEINNLLPQRARDGHKYQMGATGVIGGSLGMEGALELTCGSFLSAGGGIVFAIYPKRESGDFYPSKFIEIVKVPSNKNLEEIQNILPKLQTLVLGPGLNHLDFDPESLKNIIMNFEGTVILDSGIFPLIKDNLQLIKSRKYPSIFTPHYGELRQFSPNGDPLERARELQQNSGQIIIAKGHPTVIFSDHENFISPFGDHELATAGTGDVLCGIIASQFINKEVENPSQKAAAAVALHGKLGEISAQTLGARSVTASSLLEFFPDLWEDLEEDWDDELDLFEDE